MNTIKNRKTFLILTLSLLLLAMTACTALSPMRTSQTQLVTAPTSTRSSNTVATQQANIPNPAAVYCQEQGFKSEIRTASDGSQSGVCIFPDGSECEEWAYYRKECGNVPQSQTDSSPTEIPTPMSIDPADYQQGWWTYIHPIYLFSIMLPEDWVVAEITTFDSVMNGHTLNLYPNNDTDRQNIRMAFRHSGEHVNLWPTGVGQGEFIQQGTLDIAGQPARRMLLVCPIGEITSIWYHNAKEGLPNIARGNMEFAFIYSAGSHCEAGLTLSGKTQRVGDMIIASLKVP